MNRQEKITKTTGQILRENICTLFNLLNLLIAVALVYVHAWSNLFFIFVIAFNTIIGIAQEIKAKRLIEKLSLLSAPKAEVERNGKVQEIAVEEIELDVQTDMSSFTTIPPCVQLPSAHFLLNPYKL